jgi:polyhydroxybutyrate depolymerase
MKTVENRRWCLSLMLAFIWLPMIKAQRFDKAVQLEGQTREFIISRPTGAAPPGGYPVVVMLHGTSGNGELFYQTSGWKELGQQEKFISVFPTALSYCIMEDGRAFNFTKWNNGDLRSVACPGQTFRDDVLFIKNILDTLKSGFPINLNRIYFCGFSNGAVMAAKIAVEMSDVIAAAVVASGILHPLDSGSIQPRLPCWLTIGTMDERFLTALNIPQIPYNDSALAVLNGMLTIFTSALGLQNTYTRKDSTANLTFYEYGRLENGNPANQKFIFLLARNMFHVFPNGTNYPFFESAPLYWNLFFKNIVKSPSTHTEASAQSKKQINLFPNPAHDYIQAEFPFSDSPRQLTITDVFGKLVKRFKLSFPVESIPVQDLPPGLYLLSTTGSQGRFLKY